MLNPTSLPPVAARPKLALVEDDPGLRRSLQLLLQGRGYEVRAYASGVALLADPAVADAACLISDYRIPDIDGLAIISELRKRAWHGPAILITAYYSPELVTRATTAGFDTIVGKPFRDGTLTDTVARLTRGDGPPPSRATT
jgi:FixJ family two-component response regulator